MIIDRYRTIMAYETGCRKAPRVNLFSSPDKNYAGQAQGTASANNARVLNEAMVSNQMGLLSNLSYAVRENNASVYACWIHPPFVGFQNRKGSHIFSCAYTLAQHFRHSVVIYCNCWKRPSICILKLMAYFDLIMCPHKLITNGFDCKVGVRIH